MRSSVRPAGWPLLGMGADPGTTNVYAAYAAKHLLDEVTELRVRDGDNSICEGHDGFLATFSPWVFIDECTCGAVSWRDGTYHLEEALSGFEPFNFPELGVLNTFYVDHEEARTLPMFFPGLKIADFKLCMDDTTWRTLRTLKDLGLHRKDKVRVGDLEVSPRDLVVSLLPEPKTLGWSDAGKDLRRHSGARFPRRGGAGLLHLQRGQPREHPPGARRAGHGLPDRRTSRRRRQADRNGEWAGSGVLSPEQFNPDPFMALLDVSGMPWHIRDEETGVIDPEYIWIEEPLAA